MMKSLKDCSTVVLMIACTCAAWEWRKTAIAARAEVHTASAAVIQSTQGAASQVSQTAKAARDSLANIETQASLLRENAATAEDNLSDRWGQTNAVILAGEMNLVNQLAEANGTLSNVEEHFGEVTSGAAQIESQISSALPRFTVCDNNPACLYSRWAAGSKAFIDTMGTIDKAAPRLAASLEQMAASGAGIAHSADVYVTDFTKPRSLPRKIWDMSGAIIHGCARFC